MGNRGHNENAMRLSMLADEATQALGKVAQGEADAIEGWLAYGTALNEGRSLFPSDEHFGKWVKGNLPDTEQKYREAAMWAAANADQFEEARAAGNARTIRGIHAKWKEIEAERERERLDQERREETEADREEREEPACENVEEAETEAEAEKGVESAQDDDAREVARSNATKATEAREEASQEAETAAEPDPEPAADPYGYSKLTEEALLEAANGLRADLDDAKRELQSVKHERDQLARENKAILDGADLGPEVSRMKKNISTLKGARDDEKAKSARLQRQVNGQKKELESLRKSLESQEFEI